MKWVANNLACERRRISGCRQPEIRLRSQASNNLASFFLNFNACKRPKLAFCGICTCKNWQVALIWNLQPSFPNFQNVSLASTPPGLVNTRFDSSLCSATSFSRLILPHKVAWPASLGGVTCLTWGLHLRYIEKCGKMYWRPQVVFAYLRASIVYSNKQEKVSACIKTHWFVIHVLIILHCFQSLWRSKAEKG